MAKAAYKVLVPTSGTGSRLGELTRNRNKTLVPVGDRPALSRILDSYSKEIPIVVTLGYLGDSVKDYLEQNHRDRIFEFVWVDTFEGPGSSLGYSMLQAKDNLQCPFIFHAGDGIFVEPIPEPTTNWIGGYVEDWKKTELDLKHYTSHNIEHNKVVAINERGIQGVSLHIGLDGIFDYKSYWEILENLYKNNPNDAQLSEVHVLREMMKKGIEFTWVPFKAWLDIGNLPALMKAQKYFKK